MPRRLQTRARRQIPEPATVSPARRLAFRLDGVPRKHIVHDDDAGAPASRVRSETWALEDAIGGRRHNGRAYVGSPITVSPTGRGRPPTRDGTGQAVDYMLKRHGGQFRELFVREALVPVDDWRSNSDPTAWRSPTPGTTASSTMSRSAKGPASLLSDGRRSPIDFLGASATRTRPALQPRPRPATSSPFGTPEVVRLPAVASAAGAGRHIRAASRSAPISRSKL